MADFGYINDHRRELQSDIWAMPPLYHRLWQYLKYKVNYEEAEIPKPDGGVFLIKRGQHLTSVRGIAKGISWYEGLQNKEPNPKTVSAILEWMVKRGMIDIERGKGNREYTLITLVNWEKYQPSGVSSNTKVTPDGEATEQQADIKNNNKKELKKNKQEKTSSRQRKTYAEDSSAYRMAVYLHEKIMGYAESLGKAHLVKDADMQKWADECRKILELDKRDKAEIFQVINWATADSFWQEIILSPSNLRRKYENLCLRMAASATKPKQGKSASEKLAERNKQVKEKIREMTQDESSGRIEIIHDN